MPWGISVPNDDDHVIYVWFEALLNYIFAVQNFDEQYFIQLCGPDNLRFQGSLFQAILESGNHVHTKKLLVHGTILDSEGKKMSKSLGNVIDPIDQLEKYGLDAVRYYTLAGITTYGNGSWNEKDLIDLYNSHLADDYGNLISRTLHLIDTKNVEIHPNHSESEFIKQLISKFNNVYSLLDNFEIKDYLIEINNIVKFANKYISDTKPWAEGSDYTTILNNLYCVLGEVTKLYLPIISEKSHLIITEALQSKKKIIAFNKIKIDAL